MTEFRYCESTIAMLWHIRSLGQKGECKSGGADTAALCGRRVDWDVNHAPPLPTDAFAGRCRVCFEKFMES